jgi:hypothetical protein
MRRLNDSTSLPPTSNSFAQSTPPEIGLLGQYMTVGGHSSGVLKLVIPSERFDSMW